MSLRLITAPVNLPVRLSDMKIHLGVTVQDRDTDIEVMIRAATNFIQRWTSRVLLNTAYRYTVDAFPCEDWIQLPMTPLSSITSINYYDSAGTTQAYTGYQIEQTDDCAAIIRPAILGTWPGTQSGRVDAIKIDYVVGYGETEGTVPDEAKHAVKLLVRHWYDNAGAVLVGTISKDMEFSLKSLLRSLSTGVAVHV